MCWAPPPSLRAPHRLRQAAGALVPLQLSLLAGQPAIAEGASISSDTVLSAVGVVVAVAAASIPLALINCEKSTNKQIAATEKRIDGLEKSTEKQIAALEKSTEKQIAALEKSTEKQIAATEKRMVVIEERTKSINTKLENIDHNEQKFAKKLDKIERNSETLQKTVTSLTKRRFF